MCVQFIYFNILIQFLLLLLAVHIHCGHTQIAASLVTFGQSNILQAVRVQCRLKLLKPALQTILKNSDCKEFRVDPNGFVIPI